MGLLEKVIPQELTTLPYTVLTIITKLHKQWSHDSSLVVNNLTCHWLSGCMYNYTVGNGTAIQQSLNYPVSEHLVI